MSNQQKTISWRSLSAFPFLALLALTGWWRWHTGSASFLGQGRTLTVLVTDPSGEPLEGVEVGAWRASGRSSLPLQPAQETGVDGRVEFVGFFSGRLQLEASRDGWAPAFSQLLDLPISESSMDVTMSLTPGGQIAGRLLLPDGTPSTGAPVEAWLRRLPGTDEALLPRAPFERAVTDSEGRFLMETVAPGLYEIATRPGTGRQGRRLESSGSLQVVEGETAEVRFGDYSASGLTVAGTIHADESPLGLVELEVSADRRGMKDWALTTQTDEQGAFEVSLPFPGAYVFEVELANRGKMTEVHTLPKQDGSTGLEIRFRTGSITGALRAPDGRPFSGAWIFASAQRGHSILDRGSQHARSAEDGTFELAGLAEGAYKLRISERLPIRVGSSYLTPTLRGPIHGRPQHPLVGTEILEGVGLGTDLNLTLPPAAALEVRVTGVDGEPVKGGCLRMHRTWGEELGRITDWNLDRKGSAIAGGLPGGKYWLRVESKTQASCWQSLELVVGELRKLDVTLQPGTLVNVSAIQGGAPLLDGFAMVEHESGAKEPSGTIVDGSATVGPLAPGTYRLLVSGKGGALFSEKRTLTVGGEESIEVQVDLP